MVKLFEITAVVKQGILERITEMCYESDLVEYTHYEHGRSSGIFDFQEYGDSCEVDLFSIVVRAEHKDQIFEKLYDTMELRSHKNGIIYIAELLDIA